MQEGFTPAPHLGTPLDDDEVRQQPTCGPGPVAWEAFNAMMESSDPKLSVSEKLIAFRKRPRALQGMNLARVPTGGFNVTRPSVVVGADAGGLDINARFPVTFTTPNNPNKRMTVMPDAPLTGINGNTFYRKPDGKYRDPRGSMTVKRAEQESAHRRRKFAEIRRRELSRVAGAPPPLPEAPAPAPTSSPVLSAPAQTTAQPASKSSSQTPWIIAVSVLGVGLLIAIILAIYYSTRKSGRGRQYTTM